MDRFDHGNEGGLPKVEHSPLRTAEDTMPSKAKNLIFCNLFHSGASAIVPILEHVLPNYGINVINYGPEATERLIKEPPDEPYFHWTHHPPEFFEPLFQQDRIRVVFLHRDPRDVAVSYCADHFRQGFVSRGREQELLRQLPLGTEACHFRAACRWVVSADDRPIKIIRFDQLKEDTVAVVLEVMSFYGIDVDGHLRDAVQSIYDTTYSYEAMTGRRRGENGEIVRTRYMARKGMSGEWRDKFDNETKAVWRRHLGDHIRFLGYTV